MLSIAKSPSTTTANYLMQSHTSSFAEEPVLKRVYEATENEKKDNLEEENICDKAPRTLQSLAQAHTSNSNSQPVNTAHNLPVQKTTFKKKRCRKSLLFCVNQRWQLMQQREGTGNFTDKYCKICGTTDVGQWRRGPDGQASLCNACGLRFYKNVQREKLHKHTPRYRISVDSLLN